MTDQGNVKYVGAVRAKDIYVGSAKAMNFDDGSAPAPIETFSTLKQKGFPFGLIFKNGQASNTTVTSHMIQEATIMGAEAAFKGNRLRPGENTESYGEPDDIIDFAIANNMKLYIQPFLWNKDVAAWINDKALDTSLTRNDWINIMRDYIMRPIARWKAKYVDTGLVNKFSYGVVNEPFRESADINAGKGTYKDCVWLQKIGVDYPKIAFQAAHEADPTADLYLNEYGWEFAWLKLDAMVKFANDCLAQGIPFHGWGLQLHTGLGQVTNQAIENNMFKLAINGLKIHISELDISIRKGMPDSYELSAYPQKEAEQAAMGLGIFKSFKKLPLAQQFGITTWGTRDKDSYKLIGQSLKHDYPLFFDDNYKPKLVYKTIINNI